MIKKTIALIMTVIMAGTLMFLPVFAGEPETDEWLSDWEYEIKERGVDGNFIHLNKYVGSETDISIGGKAIVNGVDYPVCISQRSGGGYGHDITGLNSNTNIRQISFYSVDGIPVRPEIGWKLDDMFFGMENLEGVNFGDDFETDHVSQALELFYGCKNLKYVDIDNLNLDRCSVLKAMFRGCESLNRITINCPSSANFKEMFYGCEGLTEVNINCNGSDTGKLKYVDHMFYDCSSLEEFNITGTDFSGVNDFSYMFSGCSALKSIDMSIFNMSNATKLKDMFLYCNGLKEVDLSTVTWGDTKPDCKEMFYRCDNLEKVKISEDFKPDYAESIFKQADYKGKLLTIEGKPSKEFEEKVYPTLEESNRFIGYVKLRSKIELEGRPLQDRMFRVDYPGGREFINAENLEENGNVVELTVPVIRPGENTFTVEEQYEYYFDDTNSTYLPFDSESSFTCEDSTRSKTVDVVLNMDGSLSVRE